MSSLSLVQAGESQEDDLTPFLDEVVHYDEAVEAALTEVTSVIHPSCNSPA
jgi:hypothetical protein